jgi:hypothetical protein
MIRRRWASVSRDHMVISSIVRAQPVQSRVAGSIAQTLIQGDVISAAELSDLLARPSGI